jgi:hypothetical protein
MALIACACPSGLVIGVDGNNNPVVLAGPNSGGKAFGLTAVDDAVWAAFKTTRGGVALLAAGAVFDAS